MPTTKRLSEKGSDTGAEKPRRERIPFGTHRRRLYVDEAYKDKSYVYYWVNDIDDRLRQVQAAGYVFCTDKEVPQVGDLDVHNNNASTDSRVCRVVSRNTDKPILSYLMKQKREWYEEDQALKEKQNKKIDDAIRRAGSPEGGPVENEYGRKIQYSHT